MEELEIDARGLFAWPIKQIKVDKVLIFGAVNLRKSASS
jgi:hypothetical protein